MSLFGIKELDDGWERAGPMRVWDQTKVEMEIDSDRERAARQRACSDWEDFKPAKGGGVRPHNNPYDEESCEATWWEDEIKECWAEASGHTNEETGEDEDG